MIITAAEPTCSQCGSYGQSKYDGYCSPACKRRASKQKLNEICGGYVYYLLSGDSGGGAVKIGMTTGPVEARIRALQTASPSKLTLLGVRASPAPKDLESAEHATWRDLHLIGEWYRISPELLAHIRRVCDR